MKLSAFSGQEVYRKASKQLPPKGGKLSLYHLESPLILHKALREQGILGAATLSCTYISTDVQAAWCTVEGLPDSQGELALAGLTPIAGAINHRVFALLYPKKP